MKYLILFVGLCLLSGCAGWALTPQEQVERVGNIAGNIFSGNTGAAIGQTIDLVLILTGLKGLKVGGKAAVNRIKNGKNGKTA